MDKTYMKKMLRPLSVGHRRWQTNGKITKFLDRKIPTKIPTGFVSASR